MEEPCLNASSSGMTGVGGSRVGEWSFPYLVPDECPLFVTVPSAGSSVR